MEGWTLSCSCGLSGGRGGGSDRSDAVTSKALRLGKRNRKSRNDPFPRSFIQQAWSRAWANRWQMAAVLMRRNCAMLGPGNSESYTTLALPCAGTRLIEQPPIVKHLPHSGHSQVRPPGLTFTWETSIMILISDLRVRERKQLAHTLTQPQCPGKGAQTSGRQQGRHSGFSPVFQVSADSSGLEQ